MDLNRANFDYLEGYLRYSQEGIEDFKEIYKEVFSKDTADRLDDKSKEEKIAEVYSKYHDTVNMSASELESWSKNECSKKASLSDAPIERNLRLLRKKKSEWTMSDVESANRTISFVSRMKGAEKGKPVSEACQISKRDISLKNWAYNPNK